MAEIREECTKYTADYIYNIDESGYYWKIKPNRSLTTFEDPDVAHDLPLGLPIKLSFLSATCPFPFFTCVF